MKKYSHMFFGLVIITLAGCGQIPSDESMYKRSVSELEKSVTSQGGKVTVESIEKATVSLGKNGGWVELPCTITTADGTPRPTVKVVWLKRVARTWTVEEIESRTDLVPPSVPPSIARGQDPNP